MMSDPRPFSSGQPFLLRFSERLQALETPLIRYDPVQMVSFMVSSDGRRMGPAVEASIPGTLRTNVNVESTDDE